MATVTDDFKMLVAFDEDGQIKWVQYDDGDKHVKPEGSFYDDGPLKNISLHRVEELSIMIYEKSDGTKVMCPHINCNRWC